MRFYFIRHGQSENNALWDETGSNKGRSVDPELTAIGHQQARYLAEYIHGKDASARADGKNGEPKRDYFGFTHIYTSLMVRAVATATHLSDRLGIALMAWPEIHECGGMYEDGEEEDERIGLPGRPRSYFTRHYQKLLLPETVTEEGWYNRAFEAYEDRPLRAQRVLETLLAKHSHTGDRVAIISHGGFYMELMRVMFQIGEANCWYVMNNTAVSRFDIRPNGEVAMIYHNCTMHLPEHLIT